MKKLFLTVIFLSLFLPGCTVNTPAPSSPQATPNIPTAVGNSTAPPATPAALQPSDTIRLPAPKYSSGFSLEQALNERRSVRDYADSALSMAEVGQLLWSAQGKTAPWGGRTAPSAGATYPLETYLVTANVEGLAPGIFRYIPDRHELVKIREGDISDQLTAACLGQTWVKEAAINIVFSSFNERTTERYGERGIRYVHMEAGHASQNVYLQAAALNLGTVVIGAFHDDQLERLLLMDTRETALYVMPVGRIIN
ncbi:MAG TPA: SagB/ThcOx family dehydrogenase [Dehalococcoidales bacterium]|nr:SagB/ThcOx family dehydrogenase [Dehalococcoidales bacterium]